MFQYRKQSAALAAAVVATLVSAGVARAEAFTFGVMSDTQWSGSDSTGNNINSVAVNQIKACNAAFVAAGAKFVIQVGDLCDSNTTYPNALQTRLDANTALNAASIPFYGLRGNHEDNTAGQTFFNANYIPTSTSSAVVERLTGTSNYAVTYQNTKIVLLDILTADSTAAMDSATTWMSNIGGTGVLQKADHNQAFVFQHKNLLGGNHKDNAFGSSNEANITQQNNFLAALANNGVRYDMSGHDHQHERSIVTSPDGKSKVGQLICASDSYKYYTPGTPYSSREAVVSQQLNKTGYYLFTVDGPRVTGKYFETTPLSNGDVPANPVWTLSETFGYSTNGKEFLIPSGASLSTVYDSYGGTSMALIGTNSSTVKDYGNRLVSKDINTGWTDRVDGNGFASNTLTLWGMEDVDVATIAGSAGLTMSFDPSLLQGLPFIERQNADGTWTPLPSTVDFSSNTVTATTIYHDGNFAVAVPEPTCLSLFAVGALGLIARRRKA